MGRSCTILTAAISFLMKCLLMARWWTLTNRILPDHSLWWRRPEISVNAVACHIVCLSKTNQSWLSNESAILLSSEICCIRFPNTVSNDTDEVSELNVWFTLFVEVEESVVSDCVGSVLCELFVNWLGSFVGSVDRSGVWTGESSRSVLNGWCVGSG